MNSGKEQLYKRFHVLFFDDSLTDKLVNANGTTEDGKTFFRKYPTELCNLEDNTSYITFLKEYHLLLDSMIFYIITTKYNTLVEKNLKSISFPQNTTTLGAIKTKYPDIFNQNLEEILQNIVNILPDVAKISKYAHRIFPEISEDRKYVMIEPTNKQDIFLENGFKISNIKLFLNTVERNIDGVDITKLPYTCHNVMKKLLEYILQLN